jgi:hypothetical protein
LSPGPPAWHTQSVPLLTIRSSQIQSFEALILDAFIEDLCDYVAGQWPRAAAEAGSRSTLRERVASSVSRGRALGFHNRGHLTAWIDWECEFGTAFFEQDKWTWFNDILQNGLDPAIRVHRIENRLAVLRQRGVL